MSQYYDLEKASQVLNLSTAEVNRLREQGKIQGFRDGSNWKFKREDVDKYLTQRIKTGSESGEFVLAGDDEDSSLFEKDEEELTPAGDNFLDLTFDDTELPSLMGQKPADVSPAKPESVPASSPQVTSTTSPSDSGLSLDDDDNKINVDNDLDFLSLVDDDLALNMGNTDGLSLASDDDVVLGGKKKTPAKETATTSSTSPISSTSTTDSINTTSTSEASTLSLTPEDDSSFSLGLADETTPAPVVAETPSATAEADDAVFTLDDDEPEASNDSESYALADEPAKVEVAKPEAPKPQDSQSESSFSLADDDLAPEPQPVTSSSEIDLGNEDNEDDDDGIFQLADEPTVPKAQAPAPAPAPATASDSDEDFRLDPVAPSSDESDSESASQSIAVDDSSLFMQDEDAANMYPGANTGFADASTSSDAFVPMDTDASPFSPAPSADGFGEPMPAPTGMDMSPASNSGDLEFSDFAAAPMPV
ncbi:MAG: helix-turn-helix domain-containing protein, partial [Thermoguttaceae bacterium]|nr:helix-turn-helix domain-containing protein [Thermoguttaceae bacterium]